MPESGRTHFGWTLQRSRAAAALAGALAFASAPITAAWAQSDTAGRPTGPFEYVSRGDTRVIRTQVEIGIRAAEMALASLRPESEVEELARAKELARKSYVFLRYAQNGVQLVLRDDDRLAAEKLVARMALQAIDEAREHNLKAQRAIENSIPWPESREQLVAEAIQDLTDSIPAAKKAATLLFMK